MLDAMTAFFFKHNYFVCEDAMGMSYQILIGKVAITHRGKGVSEAGVSRRLKRREKRGAG